MWTRIRLATRENGKQLRGPPVPICHDPQTLLIEPQLIPNADRLEMQCLNKIGAQGEYVVFYSYCLFGLLQITCCDYK